MVTFRDFQKEFKSLELETEDDEELDRLEHIAACVPLYQQLPSQQPNISQSEGSWERSAEEEEGSGYVVVHSLFVQASRALLTVCRRQEEMNTRANDRSMRCRLYQYCIEEGSNIPDMMTAYPRDEPVYLSLPACNTPRGDFVGSRCLAATGICSSHHRWMRAACVSLRSEVAHWEAGSAIGRSCASSCVLGLYSQC